MIGHRYRATVDVQGVTQVFHDRNLYKVMEVAKDSFGYNGLVTVDEVMFDLCGEVAFSEHITTFQKTSEA